MNVPVLVLCCRLLVACVLGLIGTMYRIRQAEAAASRRRSIYLESKEATGIDTEVVWAVAVYWSRTRL